MPTTFKNLPTTLKKENIGEWYHNKKGGKMRLKRLVLENFKGIERFEMEPNGKNVSIFAENKLGKTTIADSLPWLFYDLDSQGKTFNPKPLDLTGEAAHGIASIVEAAFIFDDDEDDLILKKSFCEDWRKKHGTGKKVFVGHTTTYYVDDMEVSTRKKDYDARIAQIANSTILKLLSSTRFFAEGEQKTKRKDDPNRWDWEKRRELLFDLSDDMPTDDDIIQANPALSRMDEILNGKSAEKRKAVIKERQTGLNKLIHEIPISIKERKRDIPDITNLNLSTIEKELSEISKALTEKNEEAARIESGGEIAEKIKKQRGVESRLLEIENKISAAQNWAEAERRKKVSEFETMQRKELSSLEKDLEAEMSAHAKIRIAIKNNESANKAAEQEMAKLRLNWEAINEAVFDETNTICPTCGQEYPEEKADEIRGKFHVEKAKELDRINQTGRGIGNEVTERKNQNETDQANVSLYEEKIEELTGQIDKVASQAPELAKETEEKPVEKDKEQEALELDLPELKLNIEGLRSGNVMIAGKVQAEIFALSEKQKAENLKKQTLESHAKDQARIKELGEQQKTVAGEYEQLEKMLFIMDEFEKAKANLLEKSVNSHFKLAEFRLFNILVNGGLESCCTVCYQGIPWNAGLNFSSQIKTGLDIINTLSEHFQVELPLFIDSAESVTELIPTKLQIIRLIVDSAYKELTVKIDK